MTSIEPSARPLLTVRNLSVHFSQRRRKAPLRAVDDVSITIENQQTVGVVGESGSGKTTLGRAILGLTPIAAGSVEWLGEDVTAVSRRRRRELSADLGVIFQDPYSSLNPTRTIGQTLREMLHASSDLSRQEMDARVAAMLEQVGLSADAAARYPSNFSGGQRQRIAIARALVVQPRLVICDEAVTALDLSVQAQVLNLLRELQRDLRLSYLFIAHDLDVVRYIADRILVFYRGQVVEEGPAEELYSAPLHPYTRALLKAVPIPDPTVKRARTSATDQEQVDAVLVPDTGCPFAPRCPHRTKVCVRERPAIEPCRDGRFRVACHHWRELHDVARPAGDADGGPQRWAVAQRQTQGSLSE